MDMTQMTITEIHEALKSGSLSAQELLDFCRGNIEAQEKDVHAFVELFDDVSLGDLQDHPLSLIPMALKDNILCAGRKASAGSRMLEDYVASYDAKVTEILHDAGAYILGRTNMDEFAMGSSTETSYYGVTRNPHDLSRVPGGSSGGSAAAVASGMVFYALGSDTGGSIRQPAAYCGVVGLKPSYGAVSRRGLMALSSSLDVIGPLTRSVADARIVFQALAAEDNEDSTCVPLKEREVYQEKNTNTKVVGVPRSFLNMDGLDPEVKLNFEASLKLLEQQGYTVVDIELPLLKYALAVYYILQSAEASSNLARYDGVRFGMKETGKDMIDSYFATRSEGFGKEVKRRIMLGTHVLSSGYHDEYYYKAGALREAITKEIDSIFDTVDVIATPTTASVAFPLGAKQDPVAMYLEDIFTVPYNLSGHPAISVPSGKNDEGLAFALHLVAPLFCEEKLLDVAEDFEQAMVQ